jgi:hypothetical protein
MYSQLLDKEQLDEKTDQTNGAADDPIPYTSILLLFYSINSYTDLNVRIYI